MVTAVVWVKAQFSAPAQPTDLEEEEAVGAEAEA